MERSTGRVLTEPLYRDRIINLIYSVGREKLPPLFNALTGAKMSALLGIVNFDVPLNGSSKRFVLERGETLDDCLDPMESLTTARKVFERKIRYWDCRPMPDDERAVVSPADSKVLVGSLKETSLLFLKEKFFSFDELLGCDKSEWLSTFSGGDYAILRLTPEKYHYNHTPVAGTVVDFYEIDGAYHSCNPSAVVALVTPYSKNKRVVTIIDTDVPGGAGIGMVAMIEITAMMIGDVVQAYSEHEYDDPRPVIPGMFLKKGAPKSLYRPGSSTDVLLFQEGRVSFADDIVYNLHRGDVQSRFSAGFGRPIVETDVRVRSLLALPIL